MRSLRIATVAFLIEDEPHSVEKNIERSREYIRRAAEERADIVCLPETVTTLAVPNITTDTIRDSCAGWPAIYREFAREFGLHVIAPMYARDGAHLRNRAFVISPQGEILGHYDKVQPTGAEPFVKPGDAFPVFDLPFGRIAIMICMDIYFPEIARIYAMKGTEIIFWPTMTHGPTQVGLESQLRSRAIDNSVHIVEANLAGHPPYAPYAGRFYPGNAKVMDFNGDILASTGRSEGVAIANVDLDQPRKTSHVFLLNEPDSTRTDLERLVRMNLYSREYAAIAQNHVSEYDK